MKKGCYRCKRGTESELPVSANENDLVCVGSNYDVEYEVDVEGHQAETSAGNGPARTAWTLKAGRAEIETSLGGAVLAF